MRRWAISIILVGFCLVAVAPDGAAAQPDPSGLVIVESENNVNTTADKLENILKSKGITVFARVDHAAGAKKVGKELRPTVLLIFGNPKLGTPVMQKQQKFGIDLPMKALIYKAPDGNTYIAYNDPAYLSKRHKVSEPAKVFQTMSKALKNFTAAAAKK